MKHYIKTIYFSFLGLYKLGKFILLRNKRKIYICVHDILDQKAFNKNFIILDFIHKTINLFAKCEIIITADDGFSSWRRLLFPLCKERKWQCILFITTGLVDDEISLDKKKQIIGRTFCDTFLSKKDLNQLMGKEYLSLGIHGHEHKSLRHSFEEFKDDVNKAIEIGNNYGLDVKKYAVPYGRLEDISSEMIDYFSSVGVEKIYLACGNQSIYSRCINRSILDLNKTNGMFSILGRIL